MLIKCQKEMLAKRGCLSDWCYLLSAWYFCLLSWLHLLEESILFWDTYVVLSAIYLRTVSLQGWVLQRRGKLSGFCKVVQPFWKGCVSPWSTPSLYAHSCCQVPTPRYLLVRRATCCREAAETGRWRVRVTPTFRWWIALVDLVLSEERNDKEGGKKTN